MSLRQDPVLLGFQPVGSLNSASQSLAQGHLDARVALHGEDELSALGETFNQMASNLQSSMRQQEEGRQFLQAMVDAIAMDMVDLVEAA